MDEAFKSGIFDSKPAGKDKETSHAKKEDIEILVRLLYDCICLPLAHALDIL